MYASGYTLEGSFLFRMKKPIISVIVPMYNVEKYLRECLDSINAQTFSEYEVILVDDRSTDNTASIAKEYVEKYGKYKLVQGKGKGLGGARNSGLEVAQGEYCCFIDSDDLITKNALENYYAQILNDRDIDIVIGNMVLLNETGIVRMPEFDNIHKYNFIVDDIRDWHSLILSQTACNKLFNMSMIKENNLQFPENLVHEDLLFTPIALFFARKISVIKDEVYLYRKFTGEQTITSNINEEFYFYDRIEILNRLDKYFIEKQELEYQELIDLYKLKKFLVPFEQKIYTLYDDTFSRKAMKKLSLQLSNISYTTIKKAKKKLVEYTLLKEQAYDDYREYKKKQILNLNANNGELYLNLSESVPEYIRNVTFLEKKLKLVSEVESVKLINDELILHGYAYIDGVNISNEQLQILEIYYKSRKNPDGKYLFNLKHISRPDITYIHGSNYNYDTCGFEAIFNLHDLPNLNSKYDLYITYSNNGIEITSKLKINPKFYQQLKESNSKIDLLKITNFTKKAVIKVNQQTTRNILSNIDKRTTKAIVEQPIDEYHLTRNEVTVVKGNHVKFTFVSNRFNEHDLIIFNNHGEELINKKIQDKTVEFKIHFLKIFSLLGWKLAIKNPEGYLVAINCTQLVNVKQIFKKYSRLLNNRLFRGKKSHLGWYLVYLKAKKGVR